MLDARMRESHMPGSSTQNFQEPETQRQWSDKAIARTTPALLALFSLVTLGSRPRRTRPARPPVRRLVSQAAPDVQRRPRRRAPGTLGERPFSDFRPMPGHGKNPRSARSTPARRGMLPRLSTLPRKHSPSGFAQSRAEGMSRLVLDRTFQKRPDQPFAALQHREGWSRVQGKTCDRLQHVMKNRADQHLHQSGPMSRLARQFWLPSLAELQPRLSLPSSSSR